MRRPGQPLQPTIENIGDVAAAAAADPQRGKVLAAVQALLRRLGAKRRVLWPPYFDQVLAESVEAYVVNAWMHATTSYRPRLVKHLEEKVVRLRSGGSASSAAPSTRDSTRALPLPFPTQITRCFGNGDLSADGRAAARAAAPAGIRTYAAKLADGLLAGGLPISHDLVAGALGGAAGAVAALEARAAELAAAIEAGARPKQLRLTAAQVALARGAVENEILRVCALLGPIAQRDAAGLCRPLGADVMEVGWARVLALNHFHDRTLATAKRPAAVRPLLPQLKIGRAVHIVRAPRRRLSLLLLN